MADTHSNMFGFVFLKKKSGSRIKQIKAQVISKAMLDSAVFFSAENLWEDRFLSKSYAKKKNQILQHLSESVVDFYGKLLLD